MVCLLSVVCQDYSKVLRPALVRDIAESISIDEIERLVQLS